MTSHQSDQSFTYPLNELYFYLTDTCNLRCRHCWIEPRYLSKDQSISAIDKELFISILDQAEPLGTKGVKLTGGEPLLHPQINELLDIVRQRHLHLSVETNGILCTPELAEKIAACEHSFAAVSLDAADFETHYWIRGKEGSFAAAITGIKNLVAAGLNPQIIMTVMRRNKDQMQAVVRLAESVGAGSIKFNVLQPTARGKRMHTAGETLDITELISLGKWVDEELSLSTRLSLCFHQPPAFRSLGKMFGAAAGDGCHSCGILRVLGVLADASYALCGIGVTVSEMIFGHASRDSLKEVWLNSPILNQIRKGLPEQLQGICGDCVMKHVCMGSCLAQNYYRHRVLWAPFWYCEEAHNRGLFPETRLRPGKLS
ncbi:MAG: SynChlorMet cassette radical SAM/SPASM protein ScmF [Candidatus Tectomicrobia bacterium]|uniref:SynChlorMet cassette radical SAM/SPASM protein ScmF n=1 Tax=Tectimicrobiota bacterium TaxID=2528274 RepID=A0A933GJF4_UNCTE|nr:SynChlorMet cassette radical SAM/SPASM protein ScmF [Candidatus Tectomicrobia bacterium]